MDETTARAKLRRHENCIQTTDHQPGAVALNKNIVAFRDNEFVTGQSGSGKTTILNVIGGLDRFQSGDLVIDGRV